MNLSIWQLVTFREVMRSGSISKATSSLNRTQPAISALISSLEEELGFDLFIRERGKLTPTPEAQYLLEESNEILTRLDRTKQALHRMKKLERGKLRIACHPAASSVFMPQLLTGFLHDKPKVELTLVMRDSTAIADLIASQQFDIGLAETPMDSRASVQQNDFDLECVCVMPANDEMASMACIGPGELDGKPLASLYPEHPISSHVQQVFEQAGVRLNRRIELRTFLPGLQFVASGFCYMICDMITAYSHVLQGPHAASLVVRRFEPRINTRVSVLLPGYTPQSMIAKAFSKELDRAIKAMQSEMTQHLAGSPRL